MLRCPRSRRKEKNSKSHFILKANVQWHIRWQGTKLALTLWSFARNLAGEFVKGNAGHVEIFPRTKQLLDRIADF